MQLPLSPCRSPTNWGEREKLNPSVSPFRKGRKLKKKKFFIKGDGDKMQELT